jgi:2-alkyl-3-oxoalkanoate reductase
VKVLLAGATGAIGRPLVRRLVDAGHDVVGLTRRPDRAAALERAGAQGVVCDVCDRAALLRIADEAAPDVVVDETTELPQRYDARTMRGFYDGMAPLRLQGSPNLIDAAQATGARSMFQSVAFLYAPDGTDRLRTEDDPPFGPEAPEPWNLALPAITALERRVTDLGGLVLRYGFFYGPGTHFDAGGQFHHDVGRRRTPIVGGGSGVFSFIHVEDAAAATVRAIETPVGGILNVVDDEPLAMRDWLAIYAASLGAKPPRRVPRWLAKRLSGPLPVHFATTLQGASNARAGRELGWAPAYPSLREGLRAASTRREDAHAPLGQGSR